MALSAEAQKLGKKKRAERSEKSKSIDSLIERFKADPVKASAEIALLCEKGDIERRDIHKRLQLESRKEINETKDKDDIDKTMAMLDALSKSSKNPEEAKLEFFKELNKPKEWKVVSLKQARELPPLEPIIKISDHKGMFLAKQEIAAITGEGGIGKSLLTLQIAIASAFANYTPQYESVETAGLKVVAGNTLIYGYEDMLKRVATRISELTKCDDFADVIRDFPLDFQEDSKPLSEKLFNICNDHIQLVSHNREPIFGHDIEKSDDKLPETLPAWNALWDAVENGNYTMVILDPILAATVFEQNSATSVRHFFNALYQKLKQYNIGLLMVFHSTKSNRRDSNDKAGSISGSAAWFDAIRSAAILEERVKTIADNNKKKVTVVEDGVFSFRSVKTNYSEPFKLKLAKDKNEDEDNIEVPGFHRDKTPDNFAKEPDVTHLDQNREEPTGEYDNIESKVQESHEREINAQKNLDANTDPKKIDDLTRELKNAKANTKRWLKKLEEVKKGNDSQTMEKENAGNEPDM